MSVDFSQIVPFSIAILAVFLIYRRFRRNFGRQPLRPIRMTVPIILLLVIGCLLLPTALGSAAFTSAILGGIAAGIALAVWGAANTRFQRISNQLYYVPHTYSGIAVSLLFFGRLIYRIIQVYGTMHGIHAGTDSPNPAIASAGVLQSPLTVGLFFVLMGYYVCYYGTVLWKSKRVVGEEASLDGPAPSEHERLT